MLPASCDLVDVCCPNVFNIAETILNVAHTAITECVDPDECGAYDKFVSQAEPQWSKGDYIGVWVPDIRFAPPSQLAAKARIAGTRVARFHVKLVDSGWPTLEAAQSGAEVIEHGPDAVHAAARHSYSHIEAIYWPVIQWAIDNYGHCSQLRAYSPATPIPRLGGLAGWTFNVELQL